MPIIEYRRGCNSCLNVADRCPNFGCTLSIWLGFLAFPLQRLGDGAADGTGIARAVKPGILPHQPIRLGIFNAQGHCNAFYNLVFNYRI